MPPNNPSPPQQNSQSSIPTHQISTPAPQQPAKPKKRKSDIKNVIFTALLFILAPLLALVMIIFVFQSYVVDGSSMEPTLQNGNRVFILKLPKTISGIRSKTYIPPRNEVIVFKKPSNPSEQLIKRVIGLPGDHVVVKNNQITIYNSDSPDGFNPDANTDYGENLSPTSGSVDITVGRDELFVLGDNREPGGSLDSRSGLGLVPADNVIGTLWVRYFL
jgi:signal peptidase I